MAKADISVSVESCLHRAVRQVVQEIWDLHQVRVTDVSVTWVVGTTVRGPEGAYIKTVVVRTES